MKPWMVLSIAFGTGTLVGGVFGYLVAKSQLDQGYAESTAAYRRAVEAFRINAETPVIHEEHLENEPVVLVQHDDEGVQLEGGSIYIPAEEHIAPVTNLVIKPASANIYHPLPVAPPIDAIDRYKELYDEDYYEDDGRDKEQLTMLYSDGEALFFQNGQEIDLHHAMTLVGGSIVDDIRKAVGEGNPVVYVRNMQTDTDYEVIFEQP